MPQPTLSEVGTGTWAWVQPDGSWGLSNAGLVVDGDESLLVDTLFDLARTDAMLAAMRDAAPAAKAIDSLVNTHANGDHCWGNQRVAGAEIIASERGAAEMEELPPARLAKLMKAGRALNALGPLRRPLGALFGALGLSKGAALAEAAPFALRCFGEFEFDGIELCAPTRTFEGRLDLTVGDRTVELHELGPAHTRGDVVVHLPDESIVYTGDILFVNAHPIAWEGPVANWIAACDRILTWNPTTVVPGHGPITDRTAVQAVRDYWVWLSSGAKEAYDAGASAHQAALDLSKSGYGHWAEAERLVVNVATLYRQWDGSPVPDALHSFAAMARLGEAMRGH